MRRIAIIALAVVLALASGAQALSSALSDRQPELAAQLSPYAWRALEQQATDLVTADVEAEALDVSAAQAPAAAAVANNLLSTEALAILALAQDDAAQRDAMLDAALAATRRGRVLNSAAMFAAVDRSDSETLLAGLNRTLLLYPSQKETMIPVMVQQLADARMVPAFVTLLDSTPEWSENFFVLAAANDDLADNLGAVRLGLARGTAVTVESDRAVLRLLARNGRLDQAAAVYARMNGQDEVAAQTGPLGWENRFVPFEWQFYDQGGRFARPSTNGDALAINVRSGYGGPLARRLVRLEGNRPFFEVTHSLDSASASRMRLSLECPDSDVRWSNPMGPSPTGMRVDVALPCEYAWLTIEGRSPGGTPAISGELLQISIM